MGTRAFGDDLRICPISILECVQEEKALSWRDGIGFKHPPFGSFRDDDDRFDRRGSPRDTWWVPNLVCNCHSVDGADVGVGDWTSLVPARQGDRLSSRSPIRSHLRTFEDCHVVAISYEAAGCLGKI